MLQDACCYLASCVAYTVGLLVAVQVSQSVYCLSAINHYDMTEISKRRKRFTES